MTPAGTVVSGACTVALVNGPGLACLATARDGRVDLVHPIERWLRRRAADLRGPRDVADALALVTTLRPQCHIDTTVTTDPALAAHLGPDTRHITEEEALCAVARLYAGRPCVLVRWTERPEPAVEVWRVDAQAAQRVSRTVLDNAASVAAYCREHGLDGLTPNQVDALARAHGAESRLTPAQRPHAAALAAIHLTLATWLVETINGADAPADYPVVLTGVVFRSAHLTTALVRHCRRRCVVPPDPGGPAVAIGALAAIGRAADIPSPFAGPAFDTVQTKIVLEQCKLHYQYPSQNETTALVVRELKRGRLVAWFEGGMEWGPRALGHRSILADATNTYVLENLNVYLKQRPPYMSYALSVLGDRAEQVLSAPLPSPTMSLESPLRDPDRLPHFIRRPDEPVRYQTVDDTPAGLSRILRAFEAETGTPFLVNTSFNAVTEPIVATPIDAVRCFFGSGLDVMVVNGLVVSK